MKAPTPPSAPAAASASDPVLARLNGILNSSLDIVEKALAERANGLPLHAALKALELTTKALGYGARKLDPPQPDIDVPGRIEAQRTRLLTLIDGVKNPPKGSTRASRSSGPKPVA